MAAPANRYYRICQDYADLICVIFVAILLTIIMIGSIVLLVLNPNSRNPRFRIDTLTLSYFNISSDSTTSMVNSGTIWDPRFAVTNPNSKFVLYYTSVDVFFSYHSNLISKTIVPPFIQGKKNKTTVSATFITQPVYQYVDYRNGINSEQAPGIFQFDLVMRASVRFNPSYNWVMDTAVRNLEIYCPTLPVRVSRNSNAGSLVGGSILCSVR